MSCIHGNHPNNCEICDEAETAYSNGCRDDKTKPWVGLTEEEIDSYFEDHGWSPSEFYYPVIKAIEAKLKEKNT